MTWKVTSLVDGEAVSTTTMTTDELSDYAEIVVATANLDIAVKAA